MSDIDRSIDNANEVGGTDLWDDTQVGHSPLQEEIDLHDAHGPDDYSGESIPYGLDLHGLSESEIEAAHERRRLAREADAVYRAGLLGRLADRIIALRVLGAPEPNINVVLLKFNETWAKVRLGEAVMDDSRLRSLADEAARLAVVRREIQMRNMVWIDASKPVVKENRRLSELLDAANLSPRDREIAEAWRGTWPMPSIEDQAIRFSVSYQMVQKVERRIKAKCREAGTKLYGEPPEWTMPRARRRPGARGPVGPSSWTTVIRARRRRAA